ncbi:MAG: DUF6062 family protein [Clostridiales bacterium]|nr:DUF6062 family protein [Clostridiales bacterium]
MKEQLYTIPVNDAFNADCECPICFMYEELQNGAIDFVMGSSYMEDDVRMDTNEMGFCDKHIPMLYKNQNRLGLGLMMLTHMDKVLAEMEKKSTAKLTKPSLFKKNVPSAASSVKEYADRLDCSCYVCKRMENMYHRYLVTTLYLYDKDAGFRTKFEKSKGFCTRHYGMLYDMAPQEVSKANLDGFYETLNKVYLENFKRVRDDLEWFTDKFDYRNADAPWKNSKDALIRAIQKTNSLVVEEKKK